MTAKPDRVDAFVALMKPFGIIEAARSGKKIQKKIIHSFQIGAMAMPRSPVDTFEDEQDVEQVVSMDATLLPPG